MRMVPDIHKMTKLPLLDLVILLILVIITIFVNKGFGHYQNSNTYTHEVKTKLAPSSRSRSLDAISRVLYRKTHGLQLVKVAIHVAFSTHVP